MSEALRIVQLFDSHYGVPGGVPRYMDALGAYYEQQGHRSLLIVGEAPDEREPHVFSLGQTFPLPLNGNRVDVPRFTSDQRIREALAWAQPDILHVGITYFPQTGHRIINRVSEETGVVGTFHVWPYNRSSEVGIRLAGLLMAKSKNRLDHVLTATPELQGFAKSVFGLESTVVPCPVDLGRFRKGTRLPQYDDGKLNIMFLGRLDERKGVQHLIGALDHLDKQTLHEVRVVIGGEGRLRTPLEKQVRSLHLEKTVEFAGRIAEASKADFLASADIAALPATSGESFGIVVVESMAAGAAVIGGDNPGYRSILAKRTPDMLVNPANHKDFARQLGRLIASSAYRMDIKARQQNLEEYDISTVGATILRVYEDVLARRHRY